MSVNNVNSDYTSSDFLAKVFLKLSKLLGKPQLSECTLADSVSPYSSPFNSQAAIQDNQSLGVISPKSSSIKRIHFQSVSNIQSPRLQKQNQSAVFQQKQGFQFKEILRKNSIKLQQVESKNLKDPNSQSFTSIKIQSKHQVSAFNVNSSVEQELMLKKTQLFLKEALNGKINPQQIDKIAKQLQKGFQSSFQLDKIIQFSSQNEINKNPIQKAVQKRIFQKVRSTSVSLSDDKGIQNKKRIKSQKKYEPITKSRKQKKQQMKESKKAILKQVKKMKQLVFLNQKSLRLNKKNSIM